MPVAIPTYNELLDYAQRSVKEKTGITNFSESSVAGALIKVYVSYLSDLYDLLAQLDEQGSLSTASGANLDKIGELFGVTRLPAKAATTAGAGNAVVFRNNSDTAVTIPQGTRIWTPQDNRVSFMTTLPITVQSGAEGYVDVTAVSAGPYYNVGPSSLVAHDIGDGKITVNNILAINNGAGVESDDNYRYRISNAILVSQGANATSIRVKLLEIPGVKDVILQPFARGTGTIDVVVVSVDRRVSTGLLTQVQDVLDQTVAYGISAVAKAPEERPISLAIKVALSSQLNAALARSMVSQAARSYIDNMGVGDSLVYYELVARIMDAHPDVTNAQVRMSVDNQPVLNLDVMLQQGEKFYVRSIEVT